jgi:hypothetical protein
MMTKSIWTGACSSIIVGAAVAAMAQTPAAQQSASTSAEQKIVVTGCLKAATPAGADATATTGTTGTSTAGTAGTTGTTDAATPTDSAAAKFVLADAIISPAKADTGSAPATAGATAAAGTSSAGGAPQTYALIANGLALREHVGKKLELTGTVANQPASTSDASTPATAAGPALKVESGKVIAASCQ